MLVVYLGHLTVETNVRSKPQTPKTPLNKQHSNALVLSKDNIDDFYDEFNLKLQDVKALVATSTDDWRVPKVLHIDFVSLNKIHIRYKLKSECT